MEKSYSLSGFSTETQKLLIVQQAVRIDNAKLEERGGPAQTVERIRYLFVAISYDGENGLIALMVILGAIRGDAVNFCERAAAKSLQSNRSQLF
ncbi:MAG: hypothetical protein JO189_05110 [Deltaproteobacteria bacterium]|nr:hypothetical protein [Deltaproteobacteria bacterium]